MKKLNNKGITTIEVIISFVIVIIITISLYTTVTNYNQKRLLESYKSKIYTYKNTLTKLIQDDLIKIGLTHASYEKMHTNNSEIINTVYFDMRDGTKRKLIITQVFTKSSYHEGDEDVDDYFMIEYGTANEDGTDADVLEYPLPNIGESKSPTGKKVYDLSINNVIIKIESENILSIYIGFYHPELMTRYGINIICPIDFVSKGVDSGNDFDVVQPTKAKKKFRYNNPAPGGVPFTESAEVGVEYTIPGRGSISKPGYTLTGWNTNSSGTGISYELGEVIVPAENFPRLTDLYPMWESINIEKEFPYTGGIQTYVVPRTGIYKLEAKGGAGGAACHHGICSATYGGGLGGYSYGEIQLVANTTLYIVVGGKGKDAVNTSCTGATGGYNGGGNAGDDSNCDLPDIEPGGGGGGATHIAKSTGLLKDLASNKSAVLIVAGGGGGGTFYSDEYKGGNGGGLEGAVGKESCGTGGTQVDGQAFGLGGTGVNATSGGGGGGGGWFGGKTVATDGCQGPGGSGYINGLTNANSETGKNSGNGWAKITFISD